MFEHIVKIFKFARKSQNMTQAELAEKLGISDKAWSKIETGANQMEFWYIKPACDALNLPYLEILQEICPVLPDYQQIQREYCDGRITAVRCSGESDDERESDLDAYADWFDLYGPKMGAWLMELDKDIEKQRGGKWFDLMVTDSERALMQVLADYASKDIHDTDFVCWFLELIQWSHIKQMEGCRE